MKTALRTLMLPVAIASLSSVAMAQVIDDLEIRRDGDDGVANIQFVTRVQYDSVVISPARDLVQIFYSVLPTKKSISLLGGQRRFKGSDGIPEVTVTDEPVDRQGLKRKLIVRFAKPVPVRVRAGKGNQSIEVVMKGLGDQVDLARPSRASPDLSLVPKNFLVTLQTSTKSGFFLNGSVPASLQAYQTFTGRRIVDGNALYDINLGYFGTRAEAEAALKLLKPRFPQASVVALKVTSDAGTAVAGSQLGPGNAPAEIEAKALELMVAAQTAIDKGDFAGAVEPLGNLLNLPPNTSSRKAQELIGTARLKSGDTERARAEFEAYLDVYPVGTDSDRVRAIVADLPAKSEPLAAIAPEPESNWSGGVSTYYFGGKSKERNQEFQDSPISGLPELLSEETISDTEQGQVQSNIDLNWRKRDDEADTRFVLREAYTTNLEAGKADRNRLTALYVDRKSFTNGTSFRAGRQSPTGGGVLYRFDGLQAGYYLKPKWKINAVAGVPSDKLLDTQRRLYGFWLDAEALTDEISGSLYFNQQKIDGALDRRAVGTELRYFSGGVSVNSQFDYDQAFKGINIASVQGTWQFPDNSVINFLYDRRATSLLSLGNILFFQDPFIETQARTVQELLRNASLTELQDRVKAVTPYQTQMLIGGTTPINDQWQVGADLNLTNVEAVPALPSINFEGFPSTGNLWSVSTQLIGSNLYSKRDTHVLGATYLTGPTYHGFQLSYNNMSTVGEGWRVEPSLRYYRQSDTFGNNLIRWTPGLRVSYRFENSISLESELTYERSKRTGVSSNVDTDRVSYFFGARYDF
ncbi:hypothetical protein [Hydrogenophaga sp. PAMC20947]|uniref:hypothetical protein n=1 Tax=Hydrogenophaga sp. PAMC20947 TaxID=2565558 RepID=UPI00109D905B|nr:hypothetical protein [Hydrogenophaga sp. PAMC20947]QCB45705.1 hypothetical protein E5678_06525 [Hydrogenophaga sp. PAMC20947]